MKIRVLLAIVALASMAYAAAAQTYSIRVSQNTNLRASYSLDSVILASARAGNTLLVVGQHNHWLQISRDGRQYWMADWVGYTLVEETTSTQTQSNINIDNCCFVDRQCNSDQEWVNGWWAYQNGQCGSSAQSQQPTSTHITGDASSQIDNCCFAGWKCNSDQEWVNGWWAYQNGQCGSSAQSQQPTSTQITGAASSQIDNCCFAGWKCNTDQEWVNGYQAYQNNQCNAPAHSQPGNVNNCCNAGWNCADDRDWANGSWAYANNVCVHPSPHNTRPGEGPSCCFHGWNCTADYDWLAGRFHYQDFDGQCGSPIQEVFEGVILEGSPTFIFKVKQAFALIKRRSPEWYAYTISATRKFREKPSGGSSPLQHSINLSNSHVNSSVASLASTIVHESCHQQRWLVWVWREYEVEWTAEEAVCDTVAINAMRQIAPGAPPWLDRINEFLSLGISFDVDASANREWERAKLILSRLR